MLGLLSLVVGQTSKAAPTDPLPSAENAAEPVSMVRLSWTRRNDRASDAIQKVFIHPTILADNVGAEFKADERQAILYELDRQLCYELSRRFPIASSVGGLAAEVRMTITRLDATGRIAKGPVNSAEFYNSLPVIRQDSGPTGGIAIEGQMLGPILRNQIAAMSWARDLKPIETENPPISRFGEAMGLLQPAGLAVAEAFASEERQERVIGESDPCHAFGPRNGKNSSMLTGTDGTPIDSPKGSEPPANPGQSGKPK